MLGKPSGPDHLRAWLLGAVLRSAGVYVVAYAVVAAAVAVVLPYPGRYRRTDADLLQAWHLESWPGLT